MSSAEMFWRFAAKVLGVVLGVVVGLTVLCWWSGRCWSTDDDRT
jgi:hypothetical protein